jgi:hypothetical protein
MIKSLPPGLAESFVHSFAKGADSLLAQQDKKLASRKEFPPTLPEPLAEETPLLYRKGKRAPEIAEGERVPHNNVAVTRVLQLRLQLRMKHLQRRQKRS